MRIFISGGAKCGKSEFAENLAILQKQKDHQLIYTATLHPGDGEDMVRIAKHQESRSGKGFTTFELPFNIRRLVTMAKEQDSILLDSLTAILGNEMFMTPKGYSPNVVDKLQNELGSLLDHFENMVVVSDMIYSSPFKYDGVTENYRKSLAQLDRFMATKADIVLEGTYGGMIFHKGKEAFHELSQRLFSISRDV